MSFDRPEISPILKHIKDDKKRAEVLALLQKAKKSLEDLPRADMPGFSQVHSGDQKRLDHIRKYMGLEQKAREAIRTGKKLYYHDQK